MMDRAEVLKLARETVERFRIAERTGLKPTDLTLVPSEVVALAEAVIEMAAGD